MEPMGIVPLLKLNSRNQGTLILKGPLGSTRKRLEELPLMFLRVPSFTYSKNKSPKSHAN